MDTLKRIGAPFRPYLDRVQGELLIVACHQNDCISDPPWALLGEFAVRPELWLGWVAYSPIRFSIVLRLRLCHRRHLLDA